MLLCLTELDFCTYKLLIVAVKWVPISPLVDDFWWLVLHVCCLKQKVTRVANYLCSMSLQELEHHQLVTHFPPME